MKFKIIILIILIINMITNNVYATEEIINSQINALDMTSIIKEGKKYTKEVFPDINMENIISEIVKGNVNNKSIAMNILKLLGKEIANSITLLGSILVIIVIHSILKSIGENLGNENVAKIAYYIEYILIVALITTNFAQIINMIKEAINNLTGFMNSLLPILMALISATGQITTITVIQPILLISIILVSNIINTIILPIIIIATALDIVSNLSDKVQVGKLAKCFKSSTIWCLGFIVTIFVGVLSLEGTLTSNIDGITIKGIKTATSTFVPVVGKTLGDSVDTVLRCNIINKKCSRYNWSNSYNWNMCNSNHKINSIKCFIQFNSGCK